MKREIIDLYDEYTHTPLPRRVFLERLAQLAGGSAAAAALLPLLEGTGAEAALVAEDDARLETGNPLYQGITGEIRAYLARPVGAGRLPGVVVIHENRGLNPHIMDVVRRMALEGFLAIGPDALSSVGGTPADQDKARELIGALDREETIGNLTAAVTYLKAHPNCTGKVGCVGFCWGGGMSNQLAVRSPDLSAAVVYYGRSPASEDAAKIKVPLLLHYAGLDKRINAGVPAYEAALKRVGVRYTLHVYEGVNHAFNNDTRPARYHEPSARLAWRRTIAFFKEVLAG